jgi:hypothetical protein
VSWATAGHIGFAVAGTAVLAVLRWGRWPRRTSPAPTSLRRRQVAELVSKSELR